MRAITYDRYGGPEVLRLRERATRDPGPGEVRIQVRAASLNPRDWHLMRGVPVLARPTFGGLRRPRHDVIGSDLAGVVIDVGPGVDGLHPGDRVFGDVFAGAVAEHATVPSTAVRTLPPRIDFATAAALPLAGTTALQGLRAGGPLTAGIRVLVIGASGGVGTLAVQLARHAGASVTAVCSGGNADLVRSLGAESVIDRTSTDVTGYGADYDLILQLAGTAPATALRRLVRPGGTVVLSSGDARGEIVGPLRRVLAAGILHRVVRERIIVLTAIPCTNDLDTLASLVTEGSLRPVIDRTVPLEDTADAMAHLLTGRARGKILIHVA